MKIGNKWKKWVNVMWISLKEWLKRNCYCVSLQVRTNSERDTYTMRINISVSFSPTCSSSFKFSYSNFLSLFSHSFFSLSVLLSFMHISSPFVLVKVCFYHFFSLADSFYLSLCISLYLSLLLNTLFIYRKRRNECKRLRG